MSNEIGARPFVIITIPNNRQMKPLYILLLSLLTISCGSGNESQQSKLTEVTTTSKEDSALLAGVNAMPDVKPVRLRRFTESDVARFTIAAIMNQPPEIISARKSGGEYIVSYDRPSDGQRFTYKVKLDGPLAIWGNIDGRWRDTPDDEQIIYSEIGNRLKITQKFSDGSTEDKLFDGN